MVRNLFSLALDYFSQYSNQVNEKKFKRVLTNKVRKLGENHLKVVTDNDMHRVIQQSFRLIEWVTAQWREAKGIKDV